jgi:hypothetical protein
MFIVVKTSDAGSQQYFEHLPTAYHAPSPEHWCAETHPPHKSEGVRAKMASVSISSKTASR